MSGNVHDGWHTPAAAGLSERSWVLCCSARSPLTHRPTLCTVRQACLMKSAVAMRLCDCAGPTSHSSQHMLCCMLMADAPALLLLLLLLLRGVSGCLLPQGGGEVDGLVQGRVQGPTCVHRVAGGVLAPLGLSSRGQAQQHVSCSDVSLAAGVWCDGGIATPSQLRPKPVV
jgi:hypothetical protein